jgi:hypothetical protein
MKSRSAENLNQIELMGKDKEGSFLVKHRQTGNTCAIADTFAEMSALMAMSPELRHHMTVFF